jgi:hypothetical protein
LDTEAALAQIDDVVADYRRIENASGLPLSTWEACATRLKAAIVRLSPPGGEYVRRASGSGQERPTREATRLVGILLALRSDLEAGYTQTFTELVHAEVFSDFLVEADTLQRAGHKDAAAVIAGSVLEEHLRKLASKAGVPVGKPDGSAKKAETLNSELTTAGTYNQIQQKAVTALLGIRNSAAHGKYDEYGHEQVGAMIRDVREFVIRLPA